MWSRRQARAIWASLPWLLVSVASQKCFTYFSYVISLFFSYFCAGVCAVSSVGPTHQVSTVSGRTTIPTVGRVPVLSLARCAGRTSWRRSCCCSVSIVIGGYCSSGRTSAFHGDGIMRIFLFFSYKILQSLCCH